MDNKMLSEALISMLGAGNVRTGELMKTHTTFRIGGAADYYPYNLTILNTNFQE